MLNTQARAPRNRTLVLTEEDMLHLRQRLVSAQAATSLSDYLDRTIHGDAFQVLPLLPPASVDLLLVDPPYNLTKCFNGSVFAGLSRDQYQGWTESWLELVVPLLKPTASVYVCGEWRSSGVLQIALERHFIIKNRITWEREKGRGASRNWKNCSEDIWFCARGEDYFFDVHAVKMKRRVMAPYRDDNGRPKDWNQEESGGFRLTHPSNLWTDISVPFWSMPENTDHPTQKPEKLIAKLILASSKPGDVILDPFLGSGTTSVVAKKLGRRYIGIEREELYCLYAEKRLELADREPAIQGYSGGCFWERNTLMFQSAREPGSQSPIREQTALFDHQT